MRMSVFTSESGVYRVLGSSGSDRRDRGGGLEGRRVGGSEGLNGGGVSSCRNLQTAGPGRHAAVFAVEIHGFDGDRCEPDATEKASGVGGALVEAYASQRW